MNIPGWIWAPTLVLYAVLFVIDLLVVGRRPHVPTTAECLRWLGLYVGLGIAFGGALWMFAGRQHGVEFFAGWITEYSLSVDNLFVFLLIMARFFVPRELQQSALMWGIVIALVLRAIFIALGAAVIARYSWVFYLFGAFLIWTAVKLASGGETDDDEYHETTLVRWVARVLPSTPDFHGTKLRTLVSSKMLWTPMLIVLVALGTTDLLFALDSIPAIFGLTDEPYIVFAANVFALLGLRQLYFLLGDLLNRLVFLQVGLAVLLGFIGIKLVLEALHENNVPFINGGQPLDVPVPSIGLSLVVIVVILTVTTVASLVVARGDEEATAE
ncbi:MAG: TerC/Alx family metal homeostasis membrane protein [Actinomycetales bacterium]|nr:TerC/Alx family metal homeostasis membrane protein [Actinomycetales bacterium]